jgi:hypothetical protein
MDVPALQFRMKDDPKRLRFGSTWQRTREACVAHGYSDAALITDNDEIDEDEIHGMAYTEFIGLLLAGFQEQQHLIAEQNTKISSLEDRIQKLEQLLQPQTTEEPVQ